VPFRDSLRLAAITDTLYKPEWVADSSGVYEIPEQNQRIYLARVYAGGLTVTTHNLSTVGDTAVVTLMNLQTALGEPTVITQYVAAGSQAETVLDLFNYRIQLADETPQTATVHLSASLGSVLLTVVQMSPLTFSYYDGELSDMVFPSQGAGTAVQRLPEGWDAVHPVAVDAHLKVLNGVTGLMADVDADVRTYLESGHLAMRHVAIPALPLGTDTTAVVHDLASLISVYPDSLSAEGTLTLSGRVESHIDETMTLDVEIRAPLGFTLDPLHFPGDVLRIDNADLEDTQHGSARIRIWNRLPVGGRVFFVVDKDSNRVLPDAGADVDTVANVNIPIAPLTDGRATAATYTEFEIGLSESVLNLLRDPPFFSRTDVRIEGSDGDTLVAHAADWIKVQVVADIIYRVDTGDSE